MKTNIILLQETKLSQENYDKIINKWPQWNLVYRQGNHASSGLAILWDPKLFQSQLLDQQDNWKLLNITRFDLSFILLNIHGPIATHDKLRFWKHLTHMI